MVSLGQALPSHLTPLSPISHHSAQATMGSGDLFGHASLPYASEPQLMAASMPQFFSPTSLPGQFLLLFHVTTPMLLLWRSFQLWTECLCAPKINMFKS